MSPQIDLRDIYRRMMRNHPLGYALYEPLLRSSVKPGFCGTFKRGSWHALFDLNDNSSLSKYNLGSATDTAEKLADESGTWGPKVSCGAKAVDIGLGATVPTELPVDVGAKFQIVTSEETGAVLVTAPKIHHHRVSQEFDIRPWYRRNRQRLLEANFKESVIENGLFVVTGTYSTTRCSITAWSDAKCEVYLGSKVEVPVGPQAEAHVGWYTGKSASGWSHYDAPSGERYVVFITGIWCKPLKHLPMIRNPFKNSDSDMRDFEPPSRNEAESLATREHAEFVFERVAEDDDEERISPPPSKWAILIGIDHYINPPLDTKPHVAPLRGCVADANAMEAYFQSLGLDDRHLMKLTAPSPPPEARDKWPTKENIVNTISDVGEKASPNDIVYIHFSGHGASFKKKDFQYALVPMDFKEAGDDKGFLSGREMKQLLQGLLDKDLIVTVVLDCCHSSGIDFTDDNVRSWSGTTEDDRAKPEVTVRCLDADEWAERDTYRDGAAEEHTATTGVKDWVRGNDGGRDFGSAGQHWLSPTRWGYTLITACREAQKAYEMKMEGGEWRGILTSCLKRILTNKTALPRGLSGLSYWRLHGHLAEMVQQQLGTFYRQNTYISGMTQRAFFGSSELKTLATPVVITVSEPVQVGSKLTLSASEQLGARNRARFNIYPLCHSDTSRLLAVCEVSSVDDGNVEAALVEIAAGGAGQIVPGCPAIPQDAAQEIIVRLNKPDTGDDAALELEATANLKAIRESWKRQSKYGKLVAHDWSDPTCLQVTVDERKREYRISDRSGDVISTLRYSVSDETAPAALVKQLIHLVRFQSIREMSASSDGDDIVKLEVLGTISPSIDKKFRNIRFYYPGDEHHPEYVSPMSPPPGATIDFQPGSIVALAIDNPLKETLYFSLVSVNTRDWSIKGMYPVSAAAGLVATGTLEPGQRLLFPMENQAQPSSAAGAEGVKAYEEVVKLFVSTAPRDFGVVLLPALAGRGDVDDDPPPDGLASLYGDVIDGGYRDFVAAGDERRPVRFGIKELSFNVIPKTQDARTLDWDDL